MDSSPQNLAVIMIWSGRTVDGCFVVCKAPIIIETDVESEFLLEHGTYRLTAIADSDREIRERLGVPPLSTVVRVERESDLRTIARALAGFVKDHKYLVGTLVEVEYMSLSEAAVA